jgi:septum formation protein
MAGTLIDLPKPLILASKSPRRAQLLRQAGFEFEVIVSDIPEPIDPDGKPDQHVLDLALAKARHVASRVEYGFVLGADTIVVLDDQILGKPSSEKEAFDMLRKLSGKTHTVYTGFALIDCPGGQVLRDYETTRVTFRHLEDEEIRRYIELDHPFDKAGSYGIQDRSALFVTRIEGCYYNVVGFPLTRFYLRLKQFLEMIREKVE